MHLCTFYIRINNKYPNIIYTEVYNNKSFYAKFIYIYIVPITNTYNMSLFVIDRNIQIYIC